MSDDGRIELRVDRRTAELLRDALYDLGEHQAADGLIPQTTTKDSALLGAFLRELGGSGRMA